MSFLCAFLGSRFKRFMVGSQCPMSQCVSVYVSVGHCLSETACIYSTRPRIYNSYSVLFSRFEQLLSLNLEQQTNRKKANEQRAAFHNLHLTVGMKWKCA